VVSHEEQTEQSNAEKPKELTWIKSTGPAWLQKTLSSVTGSAWFQKTLSAVKGSAWLQKTLNAVKGSAWPRKTLSVVTGSVWFQKPLSTINGSAWFQHTLGTVKESAWFQKTLSTVRTSAWFQKTVSAVKDSALFQRILSSCTQSPWLQKIFGSEPGSPWFEKAFRYLVSFVLITWIFSLGSGSTQTATSIQASNRTSLSTRYTLRSTDSCPLQDGREYAASAGYAAGEIFRIAATENKSVGNARVHCDRCAQASAVTAARAGANSTDAMYDACATLWEQYLRNGDAYQSLGGGKPNSLWGL
jgi:hypothetical protein